MDDRAQLLYLEPDDEITSVVRRLRETDASRVVLVASGRTKATTSAVALRLLAQVATEEGREVVLVADASARALAGEAGIPTFASVADANAEGAVPLEPTAPHRAPIRVVRGEPAPAAPLPELVALPLPGAAPGDETQAVRLPPPGPTPSRSRRRVLVGRRLPRTALVVVLVGALVLAAGGVAAVLPSARVTIDPATEPLGPVSQDLAFDNPQTAAGVVEETLTHAVAGTYHDLEPAVGNVVFFNWNTFTGVEVAAGTGLASETASFGTVESIVVPRAQFISFNPPTIQAGEAQVGVQAVEPGPGGNVAAGSIDTIQDEETAAQLRFQSDNPERLVTNPEPTAGGLEASGPLVEQADVDAAVAELQTLLAEGAAGALTASSGAVFADALPESEPTIDVPDDLLGTRDRDEFELSGSLAYDRAWVSVEEVEAAARERLAAETEIIPAGRGLVAGSELVTIERTRRGGSAVVASVSVTAATVATIDEDELAGRIAGLTFDDAQTELDDMGAAVEISGWPAWVDAMPRLTWRIEIDVVASAASPSPQPS